MNEYYAPPKNAVPDERQLDAINALNVEYEDGGWLSTLVWNSRNAYLTWPESRVPASQLRMIVEGFLAEIEAIKAAHSGQDGE